MIPTTAASRVVYALRSLRRAPTYTAISVASLALGIAGAVVALGVVVSVLFRELPYRDPEGLVSVMETTDRRCAGCGDLASREIWGYWRDNTGSVFSALGRHRSAGVLAHFGDDSVALEAALVDGNVFPMLGTPPVLGRAILPDDCVPGASSVVVLSDEVWAERFRRRSLGRGGGDAADPRIQCHPAAPRPASEPAGGHAGVLAGTAHSRVGDRSVGGSVRGKDGSQAADAAGATGYD
jgi:hypothetical protein